MMERYYRRDGTTCSIMEWATSFESPETRRVALDKVGETKVSTVFLGMNHAWDDGPPLIFETMVFGGPLDGEQEQYSTEEQAVAGHAAMLARVKEAAQ